LVQWRYYQLKNLDEIGGTIMDSKQPVGESGDRIQAYYDSSSESDRFDSPHGKLEFERSKRFISKHLPKGTLTILDVGGGTGAYSFWLAKQGFGVSFVDLSPGHVALVNSQNEQCQHKLVAIMQGNALGLEFKNEAFDVVLCMGPMYHLSPAKRLLAYKEVHRVLRNDGLAIFAYISRFAAIMDGYKKGMIADPVYIPLAEGDIRKGIHESPNDERYFTLAYMHKPEEVEPEISTAGFSLQELIGVEGIFWTYPNLAEYMEDEIARERLLGHAQMIEHEPSIMGASAHFLAATRKDK
jgi:SAM-dependent methyltransferase